MRGRRRALRLVAAGLAALALAAPAAAAAQCPRTSVADVEDEVMCPVCGTPLALATEPEQARRERALIQRLVDRCASKDEIKDALVAEFGESVLAVPDDEGFGLAAYVVPAIALLAASAAIAVAAVRWRRRRPAARTAPGPAPDERDAERLEADLRRYDL
jgi:cytochrome c-type biogenesis protein CcmH